MSLLRRFRPPASDGGSHTGRGASSAPARRDCGAIAQRCTLFGKAPRLANAVTTGRVGELSTRILANRFGPSLETRRPRTWAAGRSRIGGHQYLRTTPPNANPWPDNADPTGSHGNVAGRALSLASMELEDGFTVVAMRQSRRIRPLRLVNLPSSNLQAGGHTTPAFLSRSPAQLREPSVPPEHHVRDAGEV